MVRKGSASKKNRTIEELIPEILCKEAREDFLSFVRMGFNTINPTREFQENWHINQLCKELTGKKSKNDNRIIVNIPPRNLKSICISVCFVAWTLGHDPSKRIIVTSYSSKIAEKHSLDTKKIMQSWWYKKAFPQTQILKGQNNKMKFVTTVGGFRLATSTNSSLTGEGGDILILDDPHKPSTINSAKQRQKTNEWFHNTFISRLDNPKEGKVIVVMQRLHCDDLCGILLQKKNSNWRAIVFKAIATRDEKYRKAGEALNKKHINLKDMERIKEEIGETEFLAQYQQEPKEFEGKIFQPEYFLLKEDFKDEKDDVIAFSIDSASKVGISNDFTAILIWVIREDQVILKECFKIKLEFGPLLAFIKTLISQNSPNFVLIEEKSSGIALFQELKKMEFPGRVIPINTPIEKAIRLFMCIYLFEKKRVFFSSQISNLDEVKRELCGFPSAPNDDIVDALSHFLIWYRWEFRKAPPDIKIRFL
jgi:hypothetical protein